ncbi:hypothetical protein SLS62_007833 [Diatrype stigma]|uniref:Uncharacterized protein n=1 Tax=Diatrype stigma TaxID=117547 RepID=A0AAN9UKV2_9PEZI
MILLLGQILPSWGKKDLQLGDYTWWTASPEGSLPRLPAAVPTRGAPESELVHAPFNVTALFRLVVCLHAVGLSRALALRGPRGDPLENARECRGPGPAAEDDRRPGTEPGAYRAQHQRAPVAGQAHGPRGRVERAAPQELAPAGPGSVRNYRLMFPAYEDGSLSRLHFPLAFWNAEIGGGEDPPTVIRRALLDDEHGDWTGPRRRGRPARQDCTSSLPSGGSP